MAKDRFSLCLLLLCIILKSTGYGKPGNEARFNIPATPAAAPLDTKSLLSLEQTSGGCEGGGCEGRVCESGGCEGGVCEGGGCEWRV